MASASECISTSAKNDEEKKPKNETTNATNGDSETNSLPDFEHGVNTVERKSNDGKATMLENGQHVQSLYDEKRNEDNDTVESVNERLNGDALNDNQADGNSEKSNELVKNNGDEKATMSASNDNDDDAVKAGDEKGNDKSDNEYEKYEILSAEEIDDTQTSTTTIAPETTTTTAEETTATTSGEQTTAAEEGMATLDKETTTTAEETATTTSAEETATTTSAEETTTAQTTTTTTAKDETATTTENTESKENTTPPRSQPQQRHSPNNGSPERGHHTGGCHKFPDEESRAEYMKIKSEVTGGAETSESEDEEEMPEHTHPGSHTSPDAKTKAEYRKIKYEITGEALTSESEDESSNEGEIEEADEETEKKDVTTEWMDIFGNGRLKRRILRKGKGRDTRPDRGQIVMIQTAGRLSDGTAVDWNQCLEFILGEGEVIQAWDVGVALVELDEVCELVTDARYAYGEQGREGDNPIPPNAKITYEIELLAVRDGPDMDTMSDDERIKIGDKKKELGNDLFARGDYSGAINCYQRAIKYLTPSSDEQVQVLRLKCWNNLSATQIKIKAHSAALSSCQQVLAIDPDNVKALFRKGKVLAAQGELKEAVAFVKKASLNEPGNKTIRTELTNLKRQLTSQNQEERNMYERMVGGLTEKDKNTSKHSILPWSLVFGATVVVLGGIVAALYVSRH